MEGKRKKIKKKNKNKKKTRLPFQFKTGKSNKSISKLTYGKTKAFINIEFTKKRNATHDITKDDEDGDDNDNAITTRLPVHVELAPKNNLQIPPGMNEISLRLVTANQLRWICHCVMVVAMSLNLKHKSYQ